MWLPQVKKQQRFHVVMRGVICDKSVHGTCLTCYVFCIRSFHIHQLASSTHTALATLTQVAQMAPAAQDDLPQPFNDSALQSPRNSSSTSTETFNTTANSQ